MATGFCSYVENLWGWMLICLQQLYVLTRVRLSTADLLLSNAIRSICCLSKKTCIPGIYAQGLFYITMDIWIHLSKSSLCFCYDTKKQDEMQRDVKHQSWHYSHKIWLFFAKDLYVKVEINKKKQQEQQLSSLGVEFLSFLKNKKTKNNAPLHVHQ